MNTSNTEKQSEDACKTLADLRGTPDAFGSTLGSLRRAGAHLAASREGIEHDRIELWGRRIGRTFGAVAAVALAVYLLLTFFR
jgi:hypothetical protein